MTKPLEQLIDELIKIEPSLADKKKEVEMVLTELLSAKEDLTLSEEVVTRLKQRVLATEEPQTRFQLFFTTLHMHTKQFTIGIVGGLATIAVVSGAYLFFIQTDSSEFVQRQPSAVIALEPNAFGSLSTSYVPTSPESAPSAVLEAMSSRSADTVEYGFGGGGMATNMATTEPAIADKMMILPYYNYEYVYEGESFDLPTDLSVYRRSLNDTSAKAAAAAMRNVGVDLVTIPVGMLAENITLRTAQGNGHSYHIDFRNQSVNIYEEQSMYDNTWERTGTLLSDTELKEIATRFLREKGVSLDSYGEAVVDTRYTRWQGEGTYVPQHMTVIFPLQTPEGEAIYERSGEIAAGIGVTVDQATKGGVSAWNIKTMQFESSFYELATDMDRVLEVAKQGGNIGETWYPEGAELATFTLGTPTIIYIEYYHYDEKRQRSDELYIPALRFPIVERPGAEVHYNPEFITVPLVAELLQAPVGQPEPYPMPRPMPVEPLDIPAVEPAVMMGVEG